MSTQLVALGAPTWGERFTLARRRSGKSLDRVAEQVSDVTPVSYGTLVRLEKMTVPPTDKKRRFVAFLSLLAFGYDPLDFGLDVEDVPRSITAERISELVESWNVCFAEIRVPIPA